MSGLRTWVMESAEETEAFAGDLARRLPDGAVVTLHGDLGTGKTVFARGLARGLGVAEPVTSPTFAIVQEYPCPAARWFYHLDLYRLHGVGDALACGLDEFLFQPGTVTAIEWAERLQDWLTSMVTDGAFLLPVHLAVVDEKRREIAIPAANFCWLEGKTI